MPHVRDVPAMVKMLDAPVIVEERLTIEYDAGGSVTAFLHDAAGYRVANLGYYIYEEGGGGRIQRDQFGVCCYSFHSDDTERQHEDITSWLNAVVDEAKLLLEDP